METEPWEQDYQLPADGAVDDEGEFEVKRDTFNDDLCLR